MKLRFSNLKMQSFRRAPPPTFPKAPEGWPPHPTPPAPRVMEAPPKVPSQNDKVFRTRKLPHFPFHPLAPHPPTDKSFLSKPPHCRHRKSHLPYRSLAFSFFARRKKSPNQSLSTFISLYPLFSQNRNISYKPYVG